VDRPGAPAARGGPAPVPLAGPLPGPPAAHRRGAGRGSEGRGARRHGGRPRAPVRPAPGPRAAL